MVEQRCLLSLAAVLAFSSACSNNSAADSQQDGTLSFNDGVYLETTSETSANATLGDLDGDGDLDIVLAKGRHWPLLDIVLLNDGNGSFIERHNTGDSADRTYTAALADLDEDDENDIVLGAVEAPSAVLVNNGDGLSFSIIQFGDSEGAVYGLAIGDVNRDGLPDIVTARSGAPNMLYFNSGSR